MLGRLWQMLRCAHINMKGGLRTFAAFARALGPSGGSSRSKRVQIHECCKQSNGREEPTLTNAARCTSVRYHESDQKPSTTTWVLNGFFGGVKRDGLSMCQKRAFLAGFWMVIGFAMS
ncbi:hypothetical protein OAN307_c25570 [Octadecabacter antarcticus 307]|uniref:Uncharacterized protein n=1 Tax=Octadecabacter antarcticus 307 TaxID=391626 RepID=M9R686_9RHOB|nr:hypothetical protein OAN307_c25570 [Octadecabacter antarcticus 307]